jgi:hypothetical protein
VAAVSGVLVIGLIGGSLSLAALYAAAEAVPAVGLSRLALRRRADPAGGVRFTSAGLLFISAVVYMAGLFLVLFVALLGYDGGMLGVIQRNIGMGLADMMAQRGSSNALEEVAESIAYVLPGLSGAWWLIILLANLAIAQRLLSRWKRQQRPDLALTRMALPRLLLVCLAIAVVLGLADSGDLGFVGWSLGMIFIVPYFFVGMVCMHYLSRGWPPGPFVMIGVYLVLIMRGWPALLAAVLGIAEHWIKLRDRIGGQPPV